VIAFAAVFIVLFGVMIVSTCLWAFVKPRWLFGFAKPILERDWLMFVAVGVRVALGVALLLVANDSAFPLTFKILGGLAIVAAIALPFIGVARIKTLINWMETLPSFAIRLWMVLGLALGGVLLFGIYPLFA
jgi:hypothetical protein